MPLSPDFPISLNYFQHISALFESHYKKKLQTYLGPEMKKMFTASAINIKYFRSFFFIFMKQALLWLTYATDLKFCKRVKNNTYMSKTIHHNHLLMIICYAVNMLMYLYKLCNVWLLKRLLPIWSNLLIRISGFKHIQIVTRNLNQRKNEW